jgi:hypothetical protein
MPELRFALPILRVVAQTVAFDSDADVFPLSSFARAARLPAMKTSCTRPSFPDPKMIRPLMSISYQACDR